MTKLLSNNVEDIILRDRKAIESEFGVDGLNAYDQSDQIQLFGFSLYKHYYDNIPKTYYLALSKIEGILSYVVEGEKTDSFCFSICDFSAPKRANSFVDKIYALVFDVDSTDDFFGDASDDGDLCLYNSLGWHYLIYSSYSSNSIKVKYRIIFPLAHPVTKKQYFFLWNELYRICGSRFDVGARDAAHLFNFGVVKSKEDFLFYSTVNNPNYELLDITFFDNRFNGQANLIDNIEKSEEDFSIQLTAKRELRRELADNCAFSTNEKVTFFEKVKNSKLETNIYNVRNWHKDCVEYSFFLENHKKMYKKIDMSRVDYTYVVALLKSGKTVEQTAQLLFNVRDKTRLRFNSYVLPTVLAAARELEVINF